MSADVRFINFEIKIFYFFFQLKYLEKDEFHDLRRLKRIRIDGNQLSVVIDNLFIRQKNLEFLGECEI